MRRLRIAVLAASAFVLLAGPAVAGDPPPVKGYATVDQVESLKKRVAELEAARTAKPSCACGAVCPCAATAAAVPAGEGLHVSPDGTVNARHADGVYRPVPGAPRQTPPQASSAPVICGPSGCYSPAAWSVPTYLPSYGTSATGCPGGRCPLPR